jgi:hypothetical protein
MTTTQLNSGDRSTISSTRSGAVGTASNQQLQVSTTTYRICLGLACPLFHHAARQTLLMPRTGMASSALHVASG